jgi:3-phenylpropionate/cinnamic acid dioxygenase small subunit
MQYVSEKLQVEIQQFLSHEAWLLDEHRLRDWLALLTDDIRYRMPVRRNLGPGTRANADTADFCLFDDDKKSLEMRTMRLETGMAHAEIPQSVTQRLITNVLGREADRPGELEVRSNFLVYQERLGKHGSTYIGKRNDVFRAVDGGWQIARREIQLAQTVLPSTLSIFF